MRYGHIDHESVVRYDVELVEVVEHEDVIMLTPHNRLVQEYPLEQPEFAAQT
jgi:hypothetical protein